jgi:hypothetical protein
MCVVPLWSQPKQVAYQVLNVTSDDTVETRINETAAQGYDVVRFVIDPRFQYVIVMRHTEAGQDPSVYRIFSRTALTSKGPKPPSSVEEPLSNVGAAGFRVVPRTAVLRGQQLLILLKSDSSSWEYRLTHSTKNNELDRELAELGRVGFRAIEFLPARPFRSVLLEKQRSPTPAKPFTLRIAGTSNPENLQSRLPDFGFEGYRASAVSDDFDLVLQGGNTPARDANLLVEGRAENLNATLKQASGKQLRLIPPLTSNYDRRGVFRGMVHTIGGIFEQTDQVFEYRTLLISDLKRFERDLNRLHEEGWELKDLFTHWDPSESARMMAILERPIPASTK